MQAYRPHAPVFRQSLNSLTDLHALLT